MPATGAEQLRILAARSKELGDRTLLNAARAEIRAAAQPLIAAMQESAREKLPHSGGLNEQVAGQRWSVSVLTGARSAGVRLKTTAPDTDMTNSGYVRHPVYGRRDTWVTQQIPAGTGWASNTFKTRGAVVIKATSATLNRTVAAAMAV